MKIILVLSIFLSFNLVGQTFNFGTQQHWGTTGDDPISKIIKTSDGGYIAVGFVENSNNSHQGAVYGLGDYWVVKFDQNYAIEWEKAIGGSDYDYAYDIVEYKTNKFIITGVSNSPNDGLKSISNYGLNDVWLVAIDISGSIIWQNVYGSVDASEGVFNNSIVKNSENELLIVCSSSGLTTGSKTVPTNGASDFYLISIDTNGNQLSDYSFGGSSNDFQCSIKITENGEIVIYGISSSGISANKTTPNYGSFDAWAVKMNSNKQKINEFNFGGNSSDYFFQLLIEENSYIFSGSSNSVASGNKISGKIGLYDGIIVQTDTAFNILSDNNYGHLGAFSSFDDIKAVDENIYFVGGGGGGTSVFKDQPSLGASDLWILTFDTLLNYKWNFSLGGDDIEVPICGGLFINNDYTFDLFFNSSSAGFSGDLTTSNYGQQDLFHVKISSDLGLEEKEQTINVFPNPFTSSLSITGDYKSLEIYDYLGKLMFQSEHKFNIDLNFLPTGYYVINFIDNQGRTSHKKLVKN